MNQKTLEELASELNGVDVVPVTIGLDSGNLMKSATHLYFVASRFGGWEIVEQSLLVEVTRVEKKKNFMGDTFVIHTKSGRWICKDMAEGIALNTWIRERTAFSASISTPQSSLGQDESVNDGWTKSRTSHDQKEWDSFAEVSKDTSSAEDYPSAQVFSETAPLQSSSENASSSSSHTSANTEVADEQIPEELKSVLEYLGGNKKTTNESLESLEEDPNAGKVVSIVRWVIFLWIFGSVMDLCN